MGEREDLDAELMALAQQLDLPSPPPPDVLMRRGTSRPWMARVLGAAAAVLVIAAGAVAIWPTSDDERLDVGGGSAGEAQPDLEFEGELLDASWLDNGFSVVQEPPPSYGGIEASASYVAYRYLPPTDEPAFDEVEDILDLTMEQGFVIDGGVGCYTPDLRDTEFLDCGFGASRYVGGSRVEDVNLQYTVSSAGSSFTSVIRVSVRVWPEGVIVDQPPAVEGSSTSVPVVPRDLASFPTAEPPRMPEVGDAIESDDLDVDVPVVDGLDAISPVLKPPGCRGYIVLFDSDETPMQIIDRYERALPSSLDAVRRSFPLGDTESLQANVEQSTLTITATVNGARTHVVLDLCAG
jgi:hypothetical protein